MKTFPLSYEGAVFRPPSEAQSLLIQATIGCSHNLCTYCDMYRKKKFRVRTLNAVEADIDVVKSHLQKSGTRIRKVFLCDGDALSAPTDFLLSVCRKLSGCFEALERISVYATAQNMLDKDADELASLRADGLALAYLGLESGDDATLKRIVKGNNALDMVLGARKLEAANIDLSVIVMLGIAGRARSREHVAETAKVLSAIRPRYLSFLTTMPVPGTPLQRLVDRGGHQLLTSKELLWEMKELIKATDIIGRETLLRVNHVSNQFPLGGNLPRDRQDLYECVNQWYEETPANTYPPRPMSM